MCDYGDACIVVNGRITVAGINANNQADKNLTFKNNALFRSCISKINDTFIENAGHLDFIMLMYDLLEYCDNCSMTPGKFGNCY